MNAYMVTIDNETRVYLAESMTKATDIAIEAELDNCEFEGTDEDSPADQRLEYRAWVVSTGLESVTLLGEVENP